MKKLVIFDLDGTLLNTIEDITNSINVALQKNDLPFVTIEEAKYFVGSGVDILIERLLKHELKDQYEFFKEKYYDNVKKDYLEDYAVNNAILTKPYPGIPELIQKLRKKNIKVAVLSNKPHSDTIKVIQDYFGSLEFFDAVSGKKEYNRIKPYPDGANEIIRQLEDRYSTRFKLADIMYVGDTNVDIETARNIGCESIACSWGFRKLEEIQEADYVCNTTDEVYKQCIKSYDGILILNKDKDISSNKIINDIKHELTRANFPISKIGHAGTLDPMATGVMIVLVNYGTKLSDYLMCEEKEYDCEITFGKSYDTLDITGTLLEEKELDEEDYKNIKNHIDECLKGFIGDSKQLPPMYSSIKINGQKLYNLARSGETIERSERDIHIASLQRTSDVIYDELTKEVKLNYHTIVSKGTYIRSLCEDIGKYFNLPCAMSALNRTRSGHFTINESNTINEIINKNKNHSLQLISMKDALISVGIETYELNEFLYNRVLNGLPIRIECDKLEIGLTYENELIAIYELEENNTNNSDNKKYGYKVKLKWN